MGKIRRQADQVRVNVELIDVGTSQNLWAEVFDGQMSDIFAIQSEIAEKLAARLKVELSTETESGLERASTVDPEAYELALRGRHLRKTRENRAGLAKAAEYFQQATERDPDYALAWAGLANSYYWIDPVNDVTGVWATQIVPFADGISLTNFGDFEQAVYAK